MARSDRRQTRARDDVVVTRVLDRGAIALSALCLLHCLALPLAVAAMPTLATILPDRPWVHPAILAVAAPLAGVALWRGWRRHGDRLPAAFGLAGALLLAAGVTASDDVETVLTVFGGLMLAAAHLLNWRGVHGSHGHGRAVAEFLRRP